jgi:hypothetical protein
MNSSIFVSFLAISLLGLTACVQTPPGFSSQYSRAPNTVFIQVVFDEKGCPVGTQTVTKTCPFIGESDPRDTACQEPADSNAQRKIVWESDGAQKFSLDFHKDQPFKGTTGRCNIQDESEGFSCLLRKESESPALVWDYKYDVVARAGKSDECRLDPRLFLMR